MSELLISLAILGLIAAFSIPKVLVATQDSAKKSVFRETIATINSVMHEGYLDNTVKDGYEMNNKLALRLNAIKVCNTDSSVQGCWDTTTQGNPGETNQPGFVLPNGATLTGFAGGAADGIVIDWNGTASPNLMNNTLDSDQLKLNLCFRNVPNCTTWAPVGYNGKIGDATISPASNQNTLWQWIFKS